MALRIKRVRVGGKERKGRAVHFREVDAPVVERWFMTENEMVEASRSVEPIEGVELADLGLWQPPRRGFLRSILARVGFGG